MANTNNLILICNSSIEYGKSICAELVPIATFNEVSRVAIPYKIEMIEDELEK